MIHITKPDAELLQALETAGVIDAQSAEALTPKKKAAPKPPKPPKPPKQTAAVKPVPTRIPTRFYLLHEPIDLLPSAATSAIFLFYGAILILLLCGILW